MRYTTTAQDIRIGLKVSWPFHESATHPSVTTPTPSEWKDASAAYFGISQCLPYESDLFLFVRWLEEAAYACYRKAKKDAESVYPSQLGTKHDPFRLARHV